MNMMTVGRAKWMCLELVACVVWIGGGYGWLRQDGCTKSIMLLDFA